MANMASLKPITGTTGTNMVYVMANTGTTSSNMVFWMTNTGTASANIVISALAVFVTQMKQNLNKEE